MRPTSIIFCLVLVCWPQLTSAQVQSLPNQSVPTAKLPKGYVLRNGKLYFSIPSNAQPAGHTKNKLLFDVSAAGNQCTAIPKATDATMTDDSLFSMTSDVAASLSITLPFGGGGGNGSSNQSVFMRQFKRYTTCTTPNGDILEYGQAIRASVLYDTTDVKANASFSFIVAQATINNQTTQIEVSNTGFTDAKVTSARATAIASLTGGALTIDNYGIFMTNLNSALSQADQTTVSVTGGARDGMAPALQLVGREILVVDTDLSDSLAKAFALYYIANGYGCVQAQQDFSKTDTRAQDIVKAVYTSLTKACGAPSAIDKATAQSMLRGMKIGTPAQPEDD